MRSLAGLVVLMTLFATGVNAAALKTSMTVADYGLLAESALSFPEVTQAIGSGTAVFLFKMGSDIVYVKTEGGKLVEVSTSQLGNADFTVTTSRDAFLSVMNVDDKAGVIKRMLAAGVVSVSAADFSKQAAIKAALSSGVVKPEPFGEGSRVSVNGQSGTVSKFGNAFVAKIGADTYAINRYGGIIGVLARNHLLFTNPPASAGIYFKNTPGVLAQNPGLIYDTVTHSPNVMGPHNVFKVNPGLIGPDEILKLNPGLIGPADLALLNPNLHGPKEFAYLLGIGAHSNTAAYLKSKGLVNDPTLDITDRWGAKKP